MAPKPPLPLVALLLSLALAGCLGGQPRDGPGSGAGDGGVGGIGFPVQAPLLGLAGCQGVISRFAVPVPAIRDFVHPAFTFYEGTDAREAPGSGATTVSVSAYQCDGTGDAPPGPAGVAFIFARVKAPDGVDLPEPLSYVARFYAPLTMALFADARGLRSIPANVTLDTQAAPLGLRWDVALDAPDGTFAAQAAVAPSTPADASQSGAFLAVTADTEAVTWLVANITVQAREARGTAEATGAFQAYTGGAPASLNAAVVDPLDFPILLHRIPWDQERVPPPPPADQGRRGEPAETAPMD